MATRNIKNYFDNGIDAPTDTVGQNAPGGTPKWLYRIQANRATDGFNFTLKGRGISRGVYDTSFVGIAFGCPASTVHHRTRAHNHLPGTLYLYTSIARQSELEGKSGPVRVDIGGRRI